MGDIKVLLVWEKNQNHAMSNVYLCKKKKKKKQLQHYCWLHSFVKIPSIKIPHKIWQCSKEIF